MIRLSSKITFLYKYVLPLLNLCLILFCCIKGIINIGNVEKMMPFLIGFIFFLIMQISLLPLLKIQNVFYNDGVTIIQGFKKKEVLKNHEIKEIKRHLFFFYKIEMLNNELKRVLFFPHLSETILKFGLKPKSIKCYEEVIKRANLESGTLNRKLSK
ncbi:MAG: hypothetical protein BWZ00_00580 [Bacteroidetes bacterium ADurb.BinA174]|nr:MAG: hypothetical protein BWZ00_00580 [Bacteroidetes bacterium ADurb.BinA174]